jgi:perosamine synthetase
MPSHTSSRSAVAVVDAILLRIANVTGRNEGITPLHEPEFEGREWAYLKACLDTRQVSSIGPQVREFEQALSRVTGARHVVATSSGTAALHVALLLAGTRPGDEVLMPSLAFVAVANAAAYCGATPHFVDSDPLTLGIDLPALKEYLAATVDLSGGECRNRRTGRRIAALAVLHTFGHPVDVDELRAVLDPLGLPLVEDAAQALGTHCHGRHVGSAGQSGILSFNGNKIVTSGGGGALLTNDPDVAAAAIHLTTTAKTPHRWAVAHDRVGFNYRMPNLNAALGRGQLERLDDMLSRKRQLADRYAAAFDDLDEVGVFREAPFARSNYWLNVLVFGERETALRDAVCDEAHRRGILVRAAWTPLSELPMFTRAPSMPLPHATRLAGQLIAVPSSPSLAGPARSC